jgi:hypothetical protein
MTSPSPTELRIIRSIITEHLGPDSTILKQIPSLRVASRSMTGTGYFIEFDPLPKSLRTDEINKAISTDLPTKMAPPNNLGGFTLFINDGLMTSFEGYMFGDVSWPADPIEGWLVIDESADTKRA